MPGTARGLAIDGCGEQPEEAGSRPGDLEFLADHLGAAATVDVAELGPVEFRQDLLDGLAVGPGIFRKAQEALGALVQVQNPAVVGHHDNAVLDDVEDGFEQAAFLGQAPHEGGRSRYRAG
jgi:hypothetical protein